MSSRRRPSTRKRSMIDTPDFTYDLFVSYAEADRAWVEGYLLDALAGAGLRCHSEAAFALGVPRLLEFERAVRESRHILLVLSPAYLADGSNQFTDLLAQTYGLESAIWPVIPLVLKPVRLPPRLAMLTSLNAIDPADWPQVVERLSVALQVPLPGPAPKPACPYPGMVPFDEADSARFYGRDREVQELLERLRLHPFLAVIGPSGSGKSSLVFAGLVPALRRSGLFGSGGWLVRALRPGERPMAALTAALPGQRPRDQRLLLVVDQFEEVFTLSRGDTVPFQQALLHLAQAPDCYVVLTVRADFYSDLMATPLWAEIQGHRLEVVPLEEDGLRQAILRPAEDVEVYVEAALVERLVADAAGEPGVLPLVQETLVLLWERLLRRFLPLSAYEALVMSFTAYLALGDEKRTGLQVAMTRRADAALADLSPVQQAMARRIFLRLIQFGEGRADTRRQQPVAALRSAGDDADLFDRTLRHLTESRLLTLSGAEEGADRQVDIAHEALIAGWPTLQVWLVERREAEQVRRRLEAKTAEWIRLGRETGGLLDEVELREAGRWLASPDAADLGYDQALSDLVEASRAAVEATAREKEAARQRELAQARALAAEQQRRAEEQARAARRLRRLALGLAVVFLLAVAAAVVAQLQFRRSERLRLVSITQALAAQAPRQQERGKQDERGALLARQAYFFSQRQPDRGLSEIDGALRAVLSVPYFSVVLQGHQSVVNAVAFSPDGQTLASAGVDGSVLLWDLSQPGAAPLALAGHEGEVLALAFSPDGRTLASGGVDGAVRLWDLNRLEAAPMILRERELTVFSVAFSPDGATLASGSADGLIRLWDLTQPGAPPLSLRGRQGDLDILSVAFSPDGQTLAAASGDGTLWLWDLGQPEAEPALLPGHEQGIRSVAFSPDGQTLASGSIDRSIRLWDLGQPDPAPAILDGHDGEVRQVTFSPDGRTLASASDDRTARLWRLDQPGAAPAVLRGHGTAVRAVAFSPDGRTLASGSLDNTVRLWDLGQPRAVPIVLNENERVISVAFSPDGRTLASASGFGGAQLWPLDDFQALPVPLPAGEPALSVAFSPDGETLALGGLKGEVYLWQPGRPEAAPVLLPGHEDRVYALAFSPDGRTLATGSWDRTVAVWDRGRPEAGPAILRGHEGRVWSVAISPDGQTLASGSADRTIRLWDLGRPESPPLAVLRGHEQWVMSVAFSPDGRTLASGGADETVRLWDLGQPDAGSRILPGHEDWAMAVAFSPDGQTLAAASADGTVRLWDLHRPEAPIASLSGHNGTAKALAFSPDGQMLASGGEDRKTFIWRARTETLADWVCEQVWRNLTQDEWNEFIGPDIPYERTCANLPSGAANSS
ncbi:MAG: TIR domain-containing protein [Anaerolineae bacterium]